MPKKKSKLKWTKKLPTVDGFYFWRSHSKDDLPVRLVIDSGYVGAAFYDCNLAYTWKGQWYGPIPSKEPND